MENVFEQFESDCRQIITNYDFPENEKNNGLKVDVARVAAIQSALPRLNMQFTKMTNEILALYDDSDKEIENRLRSITTKILKETIFK
jgi:DNA-directed RNA polymerase delta subunit